MVEGRQKNEWAQVSHVLAMLYNTNVAKESDLMHPHQFDPFAEPVPIPVVGVEFLKDLYIKKDK